MTSLCPDHPRRCLLHFSQVYSILYGLAAVPFARRRRFRPSPAAQQGNKIFVNQIDRVDSAIKKLAETGAGWRKLDGNGENWCVTGGDWRKRDRTGVNWLKLAKTGKR